MMTIADDFIMMMIANDVITANKYTQSSNFKKQK